MTNSPIETRASPDWWKLGPLLWLFCALLMVALYLIFNLPGSWFGGGNVTTYPGSAVGVATGSGQIEGDRLVITRQDPRNVTILALVMPPVPTAEFGLVAFDAEGIPDETDVTLFWRNDLAPNKMFTRGMTVAGGHLQNAMVAGDSNWLGRINTLGLIIRGPLSQPVMINRVTFSPATASSVLIEHWRDWLERETWTGTSLSRVIGGRLGMSLPLPLFAMLAAALAILVYWGLQRWRRWGFSSLTVAAIVATAWLVVDLRWQWNVFANAGTSLARFAGRDLSDKRLASIDGELEKVAIDLRPLIAKDARVFLVAADPVTAGRLSYLLLPAKVHYDITADSLPAPDQLHAGDLVLIHRKPGVRYSPERKDLLWGDRFHLNAEVIYLKQGTLLARVG
jgi:hypothetical protein